MKNPLIGRRNKLVATRMIDSGMLLDGGDLGEILLPNRYIPEDFEQGEVIEIFLSLDSEDRLVATTEQPLAMAGEVAMLEVVATTRVGAFLDWGMPKDLLLPFGEQVRKLKVGDRELVYINVDRASRRLVATARLRKHFDGLAPLNVKAGTQVSLQIADRTELGYMAIVDGQYWGLLRADGSPHVLARGETHTGYITRISPDGLADLSLEQPGYSRVPDAAEKLYAALTLADGFLPVHDKSPPEQIRELLGMSKKVFKQAVGALYKAGRVRIAVDGIYLQDGR